MLAPLALAAATLSDFESRDFLNQQVRWDVTKVLHFPSLGRVTRVLIRSRSSSPGFKLMVGIVAMDTTTGRFSPELEKIHGLKRLLKGALQVGPDTHLVVARRTPPNGKIRCGNKPLLFWWGQFSNCRERDETVRYNFRTGLFILIRVALESVFASATALPSLAVTIATVIASTDHECHCCATQPSPTSMHA